MAATAVWQPRDDGLDEICALLEQQISPSSVVDKSQIWKQLQHFSQFPDFNNYLVFILVRAEVFWRFLYSLSPSPEFLFCFQLIFPPYWLNLVVDDEWSLKLGSLISFAYPILFVAQLIWSWVSIGLLSFLETRTLISVNCALVDYFPLDHTRCWDYFVFILVWFDWFRFCFLIDLKFTCT